MNERLLLSCVCLCVLGLNSICIQITTNSANVYFDLMGYHALCINKMHQNILIYISLPLSKYFPNTVFVIDLHFPVADMAINPFNQWTVQCGMCEVSYLFADVTQYGMHCLRASDATRHINICTTGLHLIQHTNTHALLACI